MRLVFIYLFMSTAFPALVSAETLRCEARVYTFKTKKLAKAYSRIEEDYQKDLKEWSSKLDMSLPPEKRFAPYKAEHKALLERRSSALLQLAKENGVREKKWFVFETNPGQMREVVAEWMGQRKKLKVMIDKSDKGSFKGWYLRKPNEKRLTFIAGESGQDVIAGGGRDKSITFAGNTVKFAPTMTVHRCTEVQE